MGISYVSSDYSPFSGRNVLIFFAAARQGFCSLFLPVPLVGVDDRQLSQEK
jgi:hypothetical protein